MRRVCFSNLRCDVQRGFMNTLGRPCATCRPPAPSAPRSFARTRRNCAERLFSRCPHSSEAVQAVCPWRGPRTIQSVPAHGSVRARTQRWWRRSRSRQAAQRRTEQPGPEGCDGAVGTGKEGLARVGHVNERHRDLTPTAIWNPPLPIPI